MPDSLPPLEPGLVVGGYRLGRRLGIGGMGMVFEAHDDALQRSVALKVISPRLAEEPDFRARFEREARAQASLDSPHVVQVYAFGESDGRLYLASQLVPDGDLGHLLLDVGPPPLPVALDLIAQVADGLADAHDVGLVHRDIKPANVLIRRRGPALVAYLADFGIARLVGPAGVGHTLTASGAGSVGTPTYMAPELHTGVSAGTASDVYALGCLLWATLTGTSPYQASSDYLVIKGHLEGPVLQLGGPGGLVGGLSGGLVGETDRILRTALAKTPRERYPSAAALRDDLRRVLAAFTDDGAVASVSASAPAPTSIPGPGPAPTSAPGPPPVTSDRPRGGRRGWWIAGAGGALVVVGTAVVLVLTLGGGESTDGGTGGGTGGASGGGSGSIGAGDRDQRAAAAIAVGYEQNFGPLGMTDDQARCVARTMVADVGVDAIVDSGILDDDLGFHTATLDRAPEVDGAFRAAVLSCGAASGITG